MNLSFELTFSLRVYDTLSVIVIPLTSCSGSLSLSKPFSYTTGSDQPDRGSDHLHSRISSTKYRSDQLHTDSDQPTERFIYMQVQINQQRGSDNPFQTS